MITRAMSKQLPSKSALKDFNEVELTNIFL